MNFSGPVILFCGGLAGDGVARNTVNLANALARRGVAVEVVCLEGGSLAADLRGPRLTLLGRPFRGRGLSLAIAVPTLRRHLAARSPGAVVSMGNHAHLAVWLALRGTPQTPRIYRISNDPFHPGQGVRGRALRLWGLGLIARDATRLICVSQTLANLEVFQAARHQSRVVTLSNGVDAAQIRARAARPSDHPWVVDGLPFLVAVGRLHPQKNYSTLIESLARLRAGEHPDLRLLVLGKTPAAELSRLQAVARRHGVSAAVRFEGEVADPFPIVARASAFVLPSLWEGASNALLEAMACGVPVVAARGAGNASDVLAGGRFGGLADVEDAAALATAIERQLDPDARRLPADRVRAFDLSETLDQLCAVVLSAHRVHGQNQMLAAGEPHAGSLSEPLRGTTKEY